MQGKGKSGNNRIFATKILIIACFFKICFERNFSGGRFGWESGAPFRFSPLHIFNH
jgi:hypothetical protein